MQYLRLGSLISFLFFAALASAQQQSNATTDDVFYSVQLGNFNNALKQSDFEAVRSYAYVYKRNGTVFMGGFKSAEDAQSLVEKVKLRGFDEAQVVQRALSNEKNYFVVQVATSNVGEVVPFATYAPFGKLYVAPINNLVRLAIGYFADKNDARLKLNELYAAGFKDAFIKSVKLPQINAVSDFDYSSESVVTVTKTPNVAPSQLIGVPQSYATIAVAERRKSVMKLQEGLKKLGTFAGEPDGKFGKITDAAYAEALEKNKTLAAARAVAQKNFESNDFDDATTLMVLAQFLANTPANDMIKFDALANLPDAPLNRTEADAILNWHTNTWKKLESWSLSSKLAARSYDALKIVYYKTLTHLEDVMNERKIKGEAATTDALTAMKDLCGGYLNKIE